MEIKNVTYSQINLNKGAGGGEENQRKAVPCSSDWLDELGLPKETQGLGVRKPSKQKSRLKLKLCLFISKMEVIT